MVLSASSVSAVLKYKESPYYFFTRQLVFIVISYIVGLFIILRMPIKTYKKISTICFIWSIFITCILTYKWRLH